MSIRSLAVAAAAAACVAAVAQAGTTRLPTDPMTIEKTLCPKSTQQCARVAAAFARYNAATNDLAKAAARLNAAGDELVSAATQSYNLQYLRLQHQMQDENREYTAVSNIMKTKHDTVKNSINNIR